MTETKIPPAPRGSGPAGRKLWKSVLEEFDLAEHETAILGRVCRMADTCADLQAIVDRDGPMIASATTGEPKAHPALVELRQQGIVLTRLIVALRVPLGDEDNQHRPQHRGARGVYSLGVVK